MFTCVKQFPRFCLSSKLCVSFHAHSLIVWALLSQPCWLLLSSTSINKLQLSAVSPHGLCRLLGFLRAPSDKSTWPQLPVGNVRASAFLFLLKKLVVIFCYCHFMTFVFVCPQSIISYLRLSFSSMLHMEVLFYGELTETQLSKLSRRFKLHINTACPLRWSGGYGVPTFLQDIASCVVKLLLDEVSIQYFHFC